MNAKRDLDRLFPFSQQVHINPPNAVALIPLLSSTHLCYGLSLWSPQQLNEMIKNLLCLDLCRAKLNRKRSETAMH
jgi:hypothetical protein